jgi:hypothetical protein
MTRGLSAANQTATEAQVVRPVALVELHFDSPTGTIRLHNGLGDITANDWAGVSQTFQGVGDLGQIDEVEEADQISPHKLAFTLSGLDSTIASEVLTGDTVLRPVYLQIAYLEADHNTLIDDPHKLWKGLINEVQFEMPKDPEDFAAIRVVAESFLIAFRRKNGRLFNDADHQTEFSGDIGFEYLPQIEDIKLVWGGQTVNYGSTPGGFVPAGIPGTDGGPATDGGFQFR